MQNKFWRSISTFLGVAALLVGVFGVNALFAHQSSKTAASASTNTSLAAKKTTGHMESMHVVNMANVPAEKAGSGSAYAGGMPLLSPLGQQKFQQAKAAAGHNTSTTTAKGTSLPAVTSTKTPTATVKFPGIADSASICPYFGGCQPPDQALAVSPNWVVQGDNTSIAVYNRSGTVQAGWPKNSQNFFGVPAPTPAGCDSAHGNQPFTSDPRAFYDSADDRFWMAFLQVEGAPGFGIAASCDLVTRYWVAVSQTNNPNGAWNVYAFDMSLGNPVAGTHPAADFTELAVDSQAVTFSGNMFDAITGNFLYAENLEVQKAGMEAGAAVNFSAFFDFTVGGVPIDTIQPVGVVTRDGPRASLLINSMNGTDNRFVVWAIKNPGLNTAALTAQLLTVGVTYSIPPNADQPGCTACVDTNDSSISGTPIYRDQLINFSVNTAFNNGTNIVSGVYWGQIFVTLDDSGNLLKISALQIGILGFAGDNFGFFGASMPDNDGDVCMVYELSGATIAPKSAYTCRRVTFNHGLFHDGGVVLGNATVATGDSRWGDYEAASYDGPGLDNMWFAGENSGSTGDWATEIGETHFTLAFP